MLRLLSLCPRSLSGAIMSRTSCFTSFASGNLHGREHARAPVCVRARQRRRCRATPTQAAETEPAPLFAVPDELSVDTHVENPTTTGTRRHERHPCDFAFERREKFLDPSPNFRLVSACHPSSSAADSGREGKAHTSSNLCQPGCTKHPPAACAVFDFHRRQAFELWKRWGG